MSHYEQRFSLRQHGDGNEAHDNGAWYNKACQVVGISLRTLQRWKCCGIKDNRKGAVKRVVRKLEAETRQAIIGHCNSERYQDLNPHEIVPLLLNEGVYLASVSTFYRALKAENLVHHRSNMKPKSGNGKPPERLATGSDQVYCWDITLLPRTVKSFFFYANVVIGIFDKTIVGWSVHEEEHEQYSRRTLQGRKIALRALHADNGHPMKGISR